MKILSFVPLVVLKLWLHFASSLFIFHMATVNPGDLRKKLALLFEDSDDGSCMPVTPVSLSAQPSGVDIDKALVQSLRTLSEDEHCSSSSRRSSLEKNPYLAGFARQSQEGSKKRKLQKKKRK